MRLQFQPGDKVEIVVANNKIPLGTQGVIVAADYYGNIRVKLPNGSTMIMQEDEVKKLSGYNTDDQTSGAGRTMREVSQMMTDPEKYEDRDPKEEAKEPGGEDHVEPDGDETPPNEETIAKPPDPTQKTPAELQEDPKEELNEEVFNNLKADESENPAAMAWAEVEPAKAQMMWENLTNGSEDKLHACVEQMKSKAADPAQFCNLLAKKVGYTLE